MSFDPLIRGLHATDASHYQQTPRCVVVPVDEADCLASLRTAHDHHVAVTPRGGATALSGQTFGPGMVLDVSRHLDQILEINPDERWARVQPGVVRDRLNAELKPLGLQFAPDPATSSRATIGGMIGNNSSGTRSIVFGKTIDHLLSCRLALPDGTVIEAEPCGPEAWAQKASGRGGASPREAEVYRGVQELLEDHADEIKARYPEVMRRVAGYNLDAFVEGAGYTGPIGRYPSDPEGWNLAHLVAGSEGTLGVLLEAKVRLVPLPASTAVCVAHFDDDLAALRAVPAINARGPSAVELLDQSVLREAKVNPTTRNLAHWIEGDPAAVLLVEFFGDDDAEARRRAEALAEALLQDRAGYAHPVLTDAASQRDVWETRKLGLGLISNVPGPVKGQAFVEDACVPVEDLAGYIEKLQSFCRERGVEWSMYAHASVGVIHFRPALDLHLEDHRQKMQAIADFAFDEVVRLGGAFAGEHGDGLVRGAYLGAFFGDELYGAFRALKALFDPEGRMNPGKILDSPPMTEASLLRYGDGYRLAEVPALFQYRDQAPPPSESSDTQKTHFRGAVEQCNGVGACRKVGSGTMCPSFMATRDEKDSTRGRANALRLAMSGQLPGLEDPGEALASDGVHDVLDLCLSCKACKSECPNAVDLSRLKADALQMRHDRRGVPWGAKLVGRMPDWAPKLRGPLAWGVNKLHRLPPYRRLLEKFAGIDRRRALPPFSAKHFGSIRGSKHRRSNLPSSGSAVVLFIDTYTQTAEPHLGLAAIDLLEGCGYRVQVFEAGCCQRPRLSQGLLREAKVRGTQTLESLTRLEPDNLPILCLEPSCASALADDLPDLVDDAEWGGRVASRVQMIDAFLAQEGVELACDHAEVLLHGHCHQKALFGTQGIRKLFDGMEATACEEIDAGCCGMAGSFGYTHYELSKAIGEDRLFPAVREAVKQGKTIVACGVSCRQQIKDCLGVEAKHWVEVVKPAQQTV